MCAELGRNGQQSTCIHVCIVCERERESEREGERERERERVCVCVCVFAVLRFFAYMS